MSLQRYVSRELTHFVGRSEPDDEARYALLVKILKSGWLTHPPHDPSGPSAVRIRDDVKFTSRQMLNPDIVCFCDIPVDDLTIHMGKYGRLGLSFLKSFLVSKGVNPVFYIATDSTVGRDDPKTTRGEYFDTFIPVLNSLLNRNSQALAKSASDLPPAIRQDLVTLQDVGIKLLLQVISFCVPFDSGKEDADEENYYMEREWRIVGNVQFQLADVHRVILPVSYAGRFRSDFPSYTGQITSPE